MLNEVHEIVATCDHCGRKFREAREDGELQLELFKDKLRMQGWTLSWEDGESVACSHCDLEMEPFQKSDEELCVEPVYNEELEEEEFHETEGVGMARLTGRRFYPNERFSLRDYLEVERESDGEKFWVAR